MMNWQQKRISLKSETSGFTMIECLIAVLVVSVLLTAIAPVIVLSAANRMQARRVELASQAARTYINGVLAGTIPLPSHVVSSTQSDGKKFAGSSTSVVPAPSNTLSCGTSATNYPYCPNSTTSSLYCFDLDTSSSGCSNTSRDLIVQAFRRGGDKNFLLGVRVYRADGFDGTALYNSLASDKKLATTNTSGGGNSKAPLVEMTTEIVNGISTLKEYCDRLSCTAASPSPSPASPSPSPTSPSPSPTSPSPSPTSPSPSPTSPSPSPTSPSPSPTSPSPASPLPAPNAPNLTALTKPSSNSNDISFSWTWSGSGVVVFSLYKCTTSSTVCTPSTFVSSGSSSLYTGSLSYNISNIVTGSNNDSNCFALTASTINGESLKSNVRCVIK